MTILATRQLNAFYGDFQALFGINLHLEEGETVALIGANGAGKSTLLRAITGLVAAAKDCVEYNGASIGGMSPAAIVQLGISMIPEGRRLFPSLSVEENLLIGKYGRDVSGPWTLPEIYRLFPALRERRETPSTALSGGQQQMVAIGRALMSNPRVLLCDEFSLGLAPVVVKDIYAVLPKIKDSGTSIILVDQDIMQALSVSDRVYCLQEGRLSLSGRPAELTRDQIHAAYFGG